MSGSKKHQNGQEKILSPETDKKIQSLGQKLYKMGVEGDLKATKSQKYFTRYMSQTIPVMLKPELSLPLNYSLIIFSKIVHSREP